MSRKNSQKFFITNYIGNTYVKGPKTMTFLQKQTTVEIILLNGVRKGPKQITQLAPNHGKFYEGGKEYICRTSDDSPGDWEIGAEYPIPGADLTVSSHI